MKKLTFIILLILTNTFIIKGQDLPKDENGNISFNEVITLSDTNINKDELYSRGREWFAKSFRSANDVIQMDDKVSGKIIGKGSFEINPGFYLTPSNVHFTISLYFKDNKYKYQITDFYHVSYKSSGYSGGSLNNEKPECGNFFMFKKGWESVKIQTKEKMNYFINDLKNHMEISTKENNN